MMKRETRKKLRKSLEPLITKVYRTVFSDTDENNNNNDCNDMIERLLLNILSTNDEFSSHVKRKTLTDTEEESTELERFYQLGTSVHLEIKRMDRPLGEKTYDLPSIVFGEEFSYNNSHRIYKMFAMFIRGIRNVPQDLKLTKDDTITIHSLINISKKTISLSYVSFFGRKIALIVHSMTHNEKLLDFISKTIPIGIPGGSATNKISRRNLNFKLSQYYKFNKTSHDQCPIFGFSIDNLQYSKYVNSDVTSKKFDVPLVTTALNWISFCDFKGDLSNDAYSPRNWRRDLTSVYDKEIKEILEISEPKLRELLLKNEINFPHIIKKKFQDSEIDIMHYEFASLFPTGSNEPNMYHSESTPRNPAIVSDLIDIIQLQLNSIRETEKIYWNGKYARQSFTVVVLDGSPGKQLIRSLFNLPGAALKKENKKGRGINDSIVMVPGIMHVIMIISQIVLKMIDKFFPWIFPILGINNPFFKLSILKATHFRKSFSIAKRCAMSIINHIKHTFEIHSLRKCHNFMDSLDWANSCNDATFRLLGFLSKYVFSPLFLVDRKTITFESTIMAIKLCMHWTCPDHPNYAELLSLFLLQYYRAPHTVKECIHGFLFKRQKNGKVLFNDEIHEIYNLEVQNSVRSHRFVTVDHYLEASKKLPFINTLTRSLDIGYRNSSHSYPTEIWEEENAKIFSILFYYYQFNNERTTVLILQSTGTCESHEYIDGLKVDFYI